MWVVLTLQGFGSGTMRTLVRSTWELVDVAFQIVELLNGIFTVQDEVLARQDCYKIGTVGDQYTAVSGAPRKNMHGHSNQIATMALKVLCAAANCTIPHLAGEQPLLRIGIHTGSVTILSTQSSIWHLHFRALCRWSRWSEYAKVLSLWTCSERGVWDDENCKRFVSAPVQNGVIKLVEFSYNRWNWVRMAQIDAMVESG